MRVINSVIFGAVAVAASLLSACAGMHGATETDVEKIQSVLATTETATGQAIVYPKGAQAEVSIAVISLKHGEEITWHEHPIPVAVYVAKGEVTIEYKDHDTNVYRAGDGFVEAVNTIHRGINHGQGMAQVVVFFAGAQGVPNIKFVE